MRRTTLILGLLQGKERMVSEVEECLILDFAEFLFSLFPLLSSLCLSSTKSDVYAMLVYEFKGE